MDTDSEPLDRAFEALAHPFRRRVLRVVGEAAPDRVAVRTLSNADDATSETRAYHVDLPKLADEGYVDWNRADGTVRRGPNFEEVAPLLDLLAAHRDRLPGRWE